MCQRSFTYAQPGGSRCAVGPGCGGMSRGRYPGHGAKDAERKCLEMEIYATSAESPCRDCLLVADPESCNDTVCPVWRRWFASRWNGLRETVRSQYMDIPLDAVGICVGGRRYAPPHRRREFLAVDPCKSCSCPRALCRESCRLRQLWLAGKQEVMQ